MADRKRADTAGWPGSGLFVIELTLPFIAVFNARIPQFEGQGQAFSHGSTGIGGVDQAFGGRFKNISMNKFDGQKSTRFCTYTDASNPGIDWGVPRFR
jgi:hypothetical protein